MRGPPPGLCCFHCPPRSPLAVRPQLCAGARPAWGSPREGEPCSLRGRAGRVARGRTEEPGFIGAGHAYKSGEVPLGSLAGGRQRHPSGARSGARGAAAGREASAV